MLTFRSPEALDRYIISRMKVAMRNLGETLENELDEQINEFYGEYSPESYSRTGQLWSAVDPIAVWTTGRGAAVQASYSPNMSYSTGTWSADTVFNVAMSSDAPHGGYGAAGGVPIWMRVESNVVPKIPGLVGSALRSSGLPV